MQLTAHFLQTFSEQCSEEGTRWAPHPHLTPPHLASAQMHRWGACLTTLLSGRHPVGQVSVALVSGCSKYAVEYDKQAKSSVTTCVLSSLHIDMSEYWATDGGSARMRHTSFWLSQHVPYTKLRHFVSSTCEGQALAVPLSGVTCRMMS